MNRIALFNQCLLAVLFGLAGAAGVLAADTPEETASNEIRTRLGEYLDAFNKNDAEAVAPFWSADAISLNEETGERVVGNAAILADLKEVFQANPGLRITGQVDSVRLVRPDVAIIEGVVTLFTPDEQTSPSSFTAVMVKEEGKWMIESSQERDLPTPTTSQDALKELEWLIGDWQDQVEGAAVSTSVRWSPSNAFLIRSFQAEFEDGESIEGTQVIGWDPRSKQFRAWTFNSDGSFGEGTLTRKGEDWLLEISHITSDGGVSTATQVISRVDDDTLEIDKIGETVEGSPVPSGEPVTVLRTEVTEPAEATTGGAQ